MPITCLNNFITLRGVCSEVTPISGNYINDLAGVDLDTLANISSKEQASLKGVWDEIYRRSLNELEGDILVKMQKYIKSRILVENNLTGYFLNPFEVESATAYKKGVAIETDGSKNMILTINSIEFYTTSAISDFIYIYDYNTGQLLDQVAISTTANTINTIQINKSYDLYGSNRSFFVSYNGALTASIKTNISPIYEKSPYYPIVRGASVSGSVVESNMSFDSNSAGMLVNFSLECSINKFICSIRNLLTQALLNKLGQQIMIERLTTQRFNEYTSINTERTVELRDYYKLRYDEQLSAVLDNVQPEGDGICFKCNKSITYKYSLP